MPYIIKNIASRKPRYFSGLQPCDRMGEMNALI